MTAFVCGTSLVGWAAALSALATRAETSFGGRGAFFAAFAPAAAVGAFAGVAREPCEALVRGAVLVALIVGAVADARTGHIFDCVTLPAAVAALALAATAGDADRSALGVLAILIPFVLFAAASWMGWGDVKALFSLVLAFGPFESSLALFAACVSGIAFAQTRVGRACRPRIPFIPHLAIGASVALIIAKPVRAFIGD
jgi:prepilin signal peptidase PulO-like enzyme (type II secretory pathway)